MVCRPVPPKGRCATVMNAGPDAMDAKRRARKEWQGTVVAREQMILVAGV